MRKSGVATSITKTTTTTLTAKKTIDPIKAKFFYQGVFALRKMQLTNNKSKSAKKPTSTDSKRR
jgi:hypothetical protein